MKLDETWDLGNPRSVVSMETEEVIITADVLEGPNLKQESNKQKKCLEDFRQCKMPGTYFQELLSR